VNIFLKSFLTSEMNSIFSYKALNFRGITFVSNRKSFSNTQHNAIIKNMTSQSVCYFHCLNNAFVIFTVKITQCEDTIFIERINYSIVQLKM
jgi:hypothetical protein